MEVLMINRRNYAILAAVTFVLCVAAFAIGEHNDVLYIVDDIVFYGFVACTLALIAMTVAILVRAAVRKRPAS
jgi:hypothetical protein